MTGRTGRFVVASSVALSSAVFGAIAVPGQPPGINLVVTGLLIAMAVGMVLFPSLSRTERAFFWVAVAFLPFFASRNAVWLLGMNTFAAFSIAAFAIGKGRSWLSIFEAPMRVLVALPLGVPRSATPAIQFALPNDKQQFTTAARAASLGIGLTVIFGLLFASADRAFASLAGDLVPGWSVNLLPARVIVGACCLAVAGSYMYVGALDEPVAWSLAPTRRWQNFRLKPAEWKTALILVDLLFAAFVAIQLTVLFGGHRLVLETQGLTYAEYAREGFLQLLVVALLTLGLIAATVRFAPRERASDLSWMRVLLAILCSLTLVILASALKRMNLYQDAYGFTRLRLVVDVTIIWLALVFVLVIIAGARWKGGWLPRAVVAVTALVGLGLSASNPDALVARYNVDRFERSGSIHIGYLQTLSADAIPALDRLPEPFRSCTIAPIVDRMDAGESGWAFNLGRARARDVIDSSPITQIDEVHPPCPR